jgi:hypothetical protein
MKPRHLLIVAATLVGSSSVRAADTPPGKPSAGRWQIYPVTNGLMTDDKVVNRAENTILLDTQTGKSWLLWPTKDTPNGHSWIELIQRKDAAKTSKPE